jgi:type IV pilus assembly protein PilE
MTATAPTPRGPVRGFTLIELVIAISIVAILTTIAVPAYQQYVLRANRTVAKTVLQKIAQDQESWFGDRKTYASDFTVLYKAQSAGTRYIGNDGTMQDSASSATIYQITMKPNVSTDTVASCTLGGTGTITLSYALIATPSTTGPQAKDSTCMTLCLSSSGIKGASGTAGASSCWQR